MGVTWKKKNILNISKTTHPGQILTPEISLNPKKREWTLLSEILPTRWLLQEFSVENVLKM